MTDALCCVKLRFNHSLILLSCTRGRPGSAHDPRVKPAPVLVPVQVMVTMTVMVLELVLLVCCARPSVSSARLLCDVLLLINAVACLCGHRVWGRADAGARGGAAGGLLMGTEARAGDGAEAVVVAAVCLRARR